MKLKVKIIIIFTFLISSLNAQEVFFAGIAVSSNMGAAEQNLPNLNRVIFEENQQLRFNQLFLENYYRNPSESVTLITDRLAYTDGTTSQIALAIAIDRELVTTQQVLRALKVSLLIAGQILIFDFESGQVLGAFPITIQYNDLLNSPPSQGYIDGQIERMIFGDHENSFINLAVAKLNNIHIPNPNARRIQLTDIWLGEFTSITTSEFRHFVNSGLLGYEFTKFFQEQTGITMLPYASGQAIGGAMSSRFANGDIFNFVIPPPDYHINLEVLDFRYGLSSETNSYRQFLLGNFFNIFVFEPVTETVYFASLLRHGVTKTMLPNQDISDESLPDLFYESLLSGINSFSRSTEDLNSEWIQSQLNPDMVEIEFQKLHEFIGGLK